MRIELALLHFWTIWTRENVGIAGLSVFKKEVDGQQLPDKDAVATNKCATDDNKLKPEIIDLSPVCMLDMLPTVHSFSS